MVFLVACAPEIVLKPTPTRVEKTSNPEKMIVIPTAIPMATIVPTPRKTEQRRCIIRTGLDNGNVYMRSGPGKSYRTIKVLNEGEEVDLLDEMDGWFLIELDGDFGYIGSSLCFVEE